MASPATRRRAHEAGIDLARCAAADRAGASSAPISNCRSAQAPSRGASRRGRRATASRKSRCIGVRRVIAQRMSEAKRNIPHFSYVEEVDVTELEALRQYLNGKRAARRRR